MSEKFPDALPEHIALELAAELMKVEPDQVLIGLKDSRLKAIEGDKGIVFERGEILRFLGELDVERSGQAKPFPVVAIGSSAGGLVATSELLAGLSGWGQEEDKRKSKKAGFDAHLVKPVERATLLAAFETDPSK